MNESAGTIGQPAAAETPEETTTPDTTTPDTPQTTEATEADTTPADAPHTAQKEGEDARITKANREAANYRRQLRDAEAERDAKAAELENLLKGLTGLAGGGDDEAKPEEKLSAAETRIAELQEANRLLRVEALVGKAAAVKGADPALVMAVLSQQQALNGLNPEGDDAEAAVADAIDAAIGKYPQLVAQEAPRSSGNAAIPPEGQRLLTAKDLEQMTPEEIYEAQKAGKLNHLLGN